MNVNEYGVQFLLGTSFNMSAYTSLTLVFTKPDGTTLTVVNPNVTLSSSTVTTPAGTFLGNTYAIYVFQPGDVNQSGAWSARLTYDGPSVQLISAIARFTVQP